MTQSGTRAPDVFVPGEGVVAAERRNLRNMGGLSVIEGVEPERATIV
jgi:hypothetical protein